MRFRFSGLVLAFALCAGSAAPRALQVIPVDLRVPFAPSPVVAEAKTHLIYELEVANLGQTDLTLTGVEALDGDDGAVLRAYANNELPGVLSRPGPASPPDRRVIGGGLQAVVFIDVVLAPGRPSPRSLSHRLTFAAVTPPDAAGPQTEVDGAGTRVVLAAPLVLGPPLRGGGWLASHGLSNTSSHRRARLALNGRARIAQRFAVDWTRIGPDGRVFRGNPARNVNWTPWNAEVLAVADATVVELVDGLAENDPTADDKAIPITFETAPGNHLVLDIGGGRFVLYAHLRPGGFRVKLGQRVGRGQVLAALGNSGKTDAPHLHFQVMDGLSPLASEGLPFVFDAFEVEGHLSTLDVLVDGPGWRASGPASPRHREAPVENAVVRFAD